MEVGNIVRSIKGRDFGKVYVVFSIINEDFVSVVNGDLRKIANPKTKRIKHIELIENCSKYNNTLNDADIKKLCKSYLNGGKNA